jgi:hypothetical protein
VAIDPILIEMALGPGFQGTLKAFDTIEKRIERFEKNASRQAQTEGRTRVNAATRERREREQMYKGLFDSISKKEKLATSEAQKAAKARERAAVLAAQAATAATKKAADAELANARRAAREVDRLEAQKTRSRLRAAEMAGRLAARQASDEIRATERSARTWSQKGRRVGGIVSSSVGGIMSSTGSMAAAALGIGGGALLVDSARKQMSAERAAALLVNSATIGGKSAPGANVGNILGQAGQVSAEMGVDKTQLIGAVQNYVAKSSDFTGGMANMRFFAQMSKASGTPLEDITGAAGILRAQNKDLSAGDMRQMLLDLMEQGKQGAVEIPEMASLAGGLGATRGLYEGNMTENQRKLMALAQITRTEGTSAEEAMIGVKDLGSEAVTKAAKSTAPQWLVDAVDKKSGKIKGGPEKLIEAALLGTGGNLGALGAVFGQRGVRAFDRLAPLFQNAGGGKKGLAAVHAEMDPILNARGSQAQLDQQYAQVMAQPAEKFAKAVNAIEQTIQGELEPYLQRFADKLPELLPKIDAVIQEVARFAAWFSDNPMKGIGAIVMAAITKDLVSAGIGAAVKSAIAMLIGGGGGVGLPGVTGAGGGGGVLPKLGAAVGAVAIGGAIIEATTTGAAIADRVQSATSLGASTSGANAALGLSAKARAGTVTPADIAAAESQKAALEKRAVEERDKASGSGWQPFGMGVLGMGERKSQAQGELKNTEQSIKMFADALDKARKSIEQHGESHSIVKNNPAREMPMSDRNRTGA